MYKILAAIVGIIMLISVWHVVTNIYHVDVAGATLNKIKEYPLGEHIAQQVLEKTQLGVFYIFIFLSLVIIPGPLELTFLAIVATAPNQLSILGATIAGILVGQIINYSLGLITSRFIKPSENMKTTIDKYGAWFIFAATIIPFFPAQLVNFVAGSVKFPFRKWLVVVLLSVTLYFTIIMLAAKQLGAYLV